jgi:hypothetical protein
MWTNETGMQDLPKPFMERVVWFKIPKSSVVLSDQPITRGVETNDGTWEVTLR